LGNDSFRQSLTSGGGLKSGEWLLQEGKLAKQIKGVRYRNTDKIGLHVYLLDGYDASGDRKYKTIHLEKKSQREAEFQRHEWLRTLRSEKSFQSGSKQSQSFEALKDELRQMMVADACRRKTINRSLSGWQHFIDFLRQEYPDLQRISQLPRGALLDFQRYVTIKLNREKGWRTELQVLKSNMKRFYRAGYCGSDVVTELSDLKVPRMRETPYTPIAKDEKRKLLEFVKKDKPVYWGVLYFLMRLGWRICEILSIKTKNIAFENAVSIAIRVEAGDRKNKEELHSTLVKDDRGLRDVLLHYYNPNATCLFPNSKGKRLSYDRFNNYLKKASLKILGREITSKVFRKCVVTELLDQGVAPKNVMGITGHRDIKVCLRHYSHRTDAATKTALKFTEI